jgi:gas vesicle protein
MNKILVSLLLGVGIGILLAPDKGSATLKKLRGKLSDLGDDAKDKGDELINKGKSAFRNGKSSLADAID